MIGHALAHRDPSRVRSLAFDHLGLARAFLTAGEVESAVDAGTMALDLVGRVNSARVRDRLRELLRETSPYAGTPVISDLRTRIRDRLENLRAGDARPGGGRPWPSPPPRPVTAGETERTGPSRPRPGLPLICELLLPEQADSCPESGRKLA
jgi:hypothetical protein